MFNLYVGGVCILFGILNLMAGTSGMINEFNLVIGAICLVVGGMGVGLWIGDD